MKKVFSFLFLVLSSTTWACELKSSTVSLSAPMTGVLEELELLNSPQLKAISLFHPVQNSKIEKLSGGLFLSQKTLERFQSDLMYFDESRELRERLKIIKTKVEVPTRSKDPFELTRESVELLKPNLLGCDNKIQNLLSWLKKEEEWLSVQKPLGEAIFFLGALSAERWPEYLMVQDGFVLSLIRLKKIETFQSDLAYVRWGEKWKKTLKNQKLIGLIEDKDPKVVKVSDTQFNFYFPGALTPGIHQIKFLRYLRENWP